MNAVAHDGYVSMYEYLRQPSARKPLSELDAEPYLSEEHPRDRALADLLDAGRRSARANQGRRGTAPHAKEATRERAPKLFDVVAQQKIQSAVELREFAHQEAKAGRPALAEWCTRQGHKLEQVVANALAVLDAPAAAARSRRSRVEKLQLAAETFPCLCNGVWAAGAEMILVTNGINVREFCRAVVKALELGARRTCNIAIVGGAGCGKSSLLEPLDLIFKAAAKPQRGSTFPLSRVPEAEILLWQDYAHDEGTLAFSDLLALLTGEAVDLRMPGQLNVTCRNLAPLFMSGRTELEPMAKFTEKGLQLSQMMADRFTVFRFSQPIPRETQQADWPKCGKCAATFFIRHGQLDASSAAQGHAGHTGAVKESPLEFEGKSLPQQLLQLATLKRDGILDEHEFQAAKKRCLSAFGVA